jgi:hypothetical protein
MELPSIIVGVAAHAVGLVLALSGAIGSRAMQRGAVFAGWLGVVVTAGLTSLATVGGPTAVLAGGAFGAAAALPLRDTIDTTAGRLVVPVATTLTLASGSVVTAALSRVEPWPAATTLYVVLFAALAAAVSLYGSGAFRGWGNRTAGPSGWASRATGALVAAAGVVCGIGGLWFHQGPGASNGGIPLADGSGASLVWELPAGIEQLSVNSYRVVAPLPSWSLWAGMALVAVVWLGALVERLERGRAVRLYWGAAGLVVLAAGASVGLYAGNLVDMPSASSFVSRAETALSQAELPQRVAQEGAFSSTTAQADWAALVPLGLGLWWSSLVCFGLAAIGRRRDKESVDRPSVPAIRAGLVLWAAWLVAALIHWRLAGVVGFQSPSEWVGLGAACLATGASLVAIDSTRQARDRGDAQARLSVGAGVALLAVQAAVVGGIWAGVPVFLSLPA